MTKKCADLSKTELGTVCLTENFIEPESFYSINKSLTWILLCSESTGSVFYHIYTFRPQTLGKKVKCKGSLFLKLCGCVVCTKSYFHVSLHLNSFPLPLTPLPCLICHLNHFQSRLPFLYIKYFGIFVYLHENIRKQLQQKHKNPLIFSAVSKATNPAHCIRGPREVLEEVTGFSVSLFLFS